MRKILLQTLCFLMFFIGTGRLWAQDSTVRRYAIGISPLQFFNQGIEVHFDNRINDSRHWLIFSAAYYLNTALDPKLNNDSAAANGTPGFATNDRMNAYRLGIMHRIYFGEDSRHTGSSFISYGIRYTHYHISIHDYGWEKYQENGLNFYGFNPVTGNYRIDRLDMGLFLGGQRVFSAHFYADLQVGLLYMLPYVNTDMPGYRHYNTSMFDYAYQGFLPALGFRVGYIILWREN